MGTNDSEIVVVDHVSDPLQTDLFFPEVRILGDLVSEQTQSSPVQYLKIRDVRKTLNWARWLELVHRLDHLHFFDPWHAPSKWKPEQELTWVLNLFFRRENVDSVRNLSKMKLRELQSLLISHLILWSFCWKRDFMVGGLLAKLGNGIMPLNCSSLFANKSPCAVSHGVPTSDTFNPKINNSFTKCLWRIDYCTWIAQNVSLCPKQIPCIKSQAL